MKSHNYVLVLGTNLGNRKHNLSLGCEMLEKKGIKVLQKTQPVVTSPVLKHDQGNFLNQSLYVETELEPIDLHKITRAIEKEAGRVNKVRFGPRLLDIDLCWWSHGSFQSSDLKIPHYANKTRHWVRDALAEFLGEQLDPENGIAYRSMRIMPVQNITDFSTKKKKGEKITVITAYDYSFAKLLAKTSIDSILVGDSLGNVIQGHDSTIPVTLNHMIYHAQAVRRAMPDHFITVDMPFMAVQGTVQSAISAVKKVMRKTLCNAIKIEGAQPRIVKLIKKLTDSGVPVMGHLGLTPQSVQKLGGYRVQAKSGDEQKELIQQAILLQQAGVFALVVEMIPKALASQLSNELDIPVIGIGAGSQADGQVLVLQDMLGMNPDFSPKFVRRFAELAGEIEKATEQYCAAVREGSFPGPDESY